MERFGYDAGGSLIKFLRGESVGANFTVAEDWRYRHGPGGEREQKRQYLAPLGDNAGNAYRWTYYLLAGDRQMAVWRGTQTVNPGCDAQRAVWFEPLEYYAYGTGRVHDVAISPTTGKRYLLKDHLGSVRAVLDATGTPVAQNDFAPFGAVSATYGALNDKGFIGKEVDNESNQGDYGARKYDPDVGRFLSVDALWEDFRGLTPYQYSANSPLIFSDGNGRKFSYENDQPRQAYDQLYHSLKPELQDMLKRLHRSDVVYHINIHAVAGLHLARDNFDGQAYYDFGENRFEVHVKAGIPNTIGILGEELTHAYQFETGKIGFVPIGGKPWSSAIGYDVKDEVQSKQGHKTAARAINPNAVIPAYVEQAIEGSNRSIVDMLSSTNVLSAKGYKFADGGLTKSIPASENMTQEQLLDRFPNGFILRKEIPNTGGEFETIRYK